MFLQKMSKDLFTHVKIIVNVLTVCVYIKYVSGFIMAWKYFPLDWFRRYFWQNPAKWKLSFFKKNLKDHFLWKGFNCVKGVNNYKFYARNFKSLTATVIKNQNNLIPPGIRHNESNDAKKQIKSYKKHLLI